VGGYTVLPPYRKEGGRVEGKKEDALMKMGTPKLSPRKKLGRGVGGNSLWRGGFVRRCWTRTSVIESGASGRGSSTMARAHRLQGKGLVTSIHCGGHASLGGGIKKSSPVGVKSTFAPPPISPKKALDAEGRPLFTGGVSQDLFQNSFTKGQHILKERALLEKGRLSGRSTQ